MGGRSLFDWNGIGAIAFLGGDAIAFWLRWCWVRSLLFFLWRCDRFLVDVVEVYLISDILRK